MRYLLCFLIAALAACAPITQTATLSKPAGVHAYASVGDVMIRADAEESLPNVFGKADVFGRTRNRGFSELRYMGLNGAKQPVFRRRDVDIVTNATTMTRSGVSAAMINAQPSGGGITVTGAGISSLRENTQVLPPDTIDFVLDLSKGRTITIQDHSIEIVEATPAGVTFVPR